MKKIPITILILALIFLSVNFLNFTKPAPDEALQKVTTQFHQGLDNLEVRIDELYEFVLDFKKDSTQLEAMRKGLLDTRLSFKKIEYHLEYNDPTAIKQWMNGAPLPTLEKKVTEIRVIEPQGLQTLDELVFSNNPREELEAILTKLETLKKRYINIKKYQASVPTTHRHVFEAVRRQLLRVFTLGVTGFDTPGSVNAMPEAMVSILAITDAMDAYYPVINQNDPKLASQLGGLLRETSAYLAAHYDFDSFDRLYFLRQYINPLYSLTYKAHKATGIETASEAEYGILKPINYEAENIFDKDFLNVNYFSNIDLKGEHIPKRIALGKTLFFDPILSSDIQSSCASCHQPEKAFTDGLPKSVVSNGQKTVKRNSPSVINSVFSERYFYDMRQEKLSQQIKHVVLDTLEFATSFSEILNKLKKSDEYVQLFEEAYPDFPQYAVSPHSLTDALATYVASLHFFNSPVDQYIRGEKEDLDSAVKRGFNLFMGKAACGTCHFAPNFNGMIPPLYTETESEVLGVPITPDTINVTIDPDLGRLGSKRPQDEVEFYRHSFKTVTVRNIDRTAPYMHNGVYKTLEQVVDFYNRGGGAGMGMDLPYQTLPFSELNLTAQEQADIVAFMEALNDELPKDLVPSTLPKFEGKEEWNKRKIGAY